MQSPDPKRYITKCSECGTELTGIDSPIPQTCRCGKITASSGTVKENETKKKEKQISMFDFPGEYPG